MTRFGSQEHPNSIGAKADAKQRKMIREGRQRMAQDARSLEMWAFKGFVSGDFLPYDLEPEVKKNDADTEPEGE